MRKWAYTNGHLALENAIAALNMPKGGEVITTPFTFASTTHAIVRNGLVPVFCDIKEDDYTIDTQKLENLITDNTVAIVPVHVYGNMCDVEEIDTVATKNVAFSLSRRHHRPHPHQLRPTLCTSLLSPQIYSSSAVDRSGRRSVGIHVP